MPSHVEARKGYFRRYLEPLWLRPESALWYAHEAVAARALLGSPIRRPSMELACFDGVPTFLMLGGEFKITSDVYAEVVWQTGSHVWKSMKEDYYDVVRSQDEGLGIRSRAGDGFDIGVTWKESHLAKAARLGIYQELVRHDIGTGLQPFESGRFETIWAPNFYWVEQLDHVLGEVRRVLSSDGRFITVLPDRGVLDRMIYRHVDRLDSEWIRDIDRGRYNNFAKNARNYSEWLQLFERAGLEVSRHEDIVPSVVLNVHDLGFRPMFPVFMNMYETLKRDLPEEWLNIKKHWVDTAFHFLSPLCDTEWMDEMGMVKVWHIFELTPKRVG